MSDLDDARKLWLEEEARFNTYAGLIADQIKLALRPLGIWFEVAYRAKTIDSLVKKLIKKPAHTYGSLPDKAGVRVVGRYRSDLPEAVNAIGVALHCGSIDWKAGSVDRVGYASVHVDFVRLLSSHSEQKFFPVNHFWVELQIRTLAQHLWSEMSHDSVYKSDETIQTLPEDVKRRVHLMAGQIEVADREFDRLGAETQSEDAIKLLHFLERYYYRLTSKRPDVELSLMTLRAMLPLYHRPLGEVEGILASFFEKKERFLNSKFAQVEQPDEPPASPLLHQPEMLLLFERLVDDETTTRRAWSEKFPDRELENLANDLGISFQ